MEQLFSFNQAMALAAVMDNIYDGLYIVDRERTIRFWNHGAETISGFPAAAVVGHSCADNILTHMDRQGNLLCLSDCPLAATMHDGTPRECGKIYLHHRLGHRIPVHLRIIPLTDSSGAIVGGLEIFTADTSDTPQQQRIRELEKLALLDSLTQLANRRFLDQELNKRLNEQQRFGTPFGLLLLDVDHFKGINDRYGHQIGDRMLQLIARTLTANARPFDLFGRWGGEEFLGIIRNIDHEGLRGLAERLRLLIHTTYLVHEDDKIQLTVSLGATMAAPGDSPETLFARVDKLLFQSKKGGRNRLTMD